MRLILFFFLLSRTLFSQELFFESKTTQDGLSNNSVHAITSDPRGVIYIGTWDGLNVYDGKKFIVFKHQHNEPTSIAGNTIYALQWDTAGYLWVMTEAKAISRYDGKLAFKNYTLPSTVKGLHRDDKGNLLIALSNGVWKAYKEDAFVTVNAPKLTKEREKETYKATLEKQLGALGYTGVHINAIAPLANHMLLVATKKHGLFQLENKGDALVVRYNYKVDNYHPLSLLSNEVESLHEDIHQHMIIGLKDGGIARVIYPNAGIDLVLAHNKEQPYLPLESIRTIVQDTDGKTILGYYTQGLFKEGTDGVYRPFSIDKFSADENWHRVRSSYLDTEGDLWFGTYAGIMRISKGNTQYYTTPLVSELMTNRTYAITQDYAGHLWFGGWGGLSKFNYLTQAFEPFANQEKLRQYNIRSIVTKDDQLLLGTEKHGLVVYNQSSGEIKAVNKAQGLLGSSIYDIYVDSFTQQIWLATLGGVVILNDSFQVIHTLTAKDGLPSHLVYSLLPVGDQVWVSTTKGIAAIDKGSLIVLNYANNYNWQGVEFAEGAFYKSKDDFLFYGGSQGLNRVNPRKLSKPSRQPDFRIWVDHKIIGNSTEIIKQADDNKLELALYPIGLDYYPANQFEYRILGLFSDWRVLPQEAIIFDNLSSAIYSLEVRDSSIDNDTIIFQKNITILRPFYLQTWFVLFLVCSLVVGFSFFAWRKRRQLLKRELLLRQEVKARTTEVQEQKKVLATQNEVLNSSNQAMLRQKEELFVLHSRLKNDDIEMEKFRVFLLSRIKKPLVAILDLMGEKERDRPLREQLIAMYDMVSQWDYLEQIKHLGEQEQVMLHFPTFMQHLSTHCQELNAKHQIALECQWEVYEHVWIKVDALRLKLMFTYFVHECSKFLGRDEGLSIHFTIAGGEQMILSFTSTSEMLFQYWKENKQFSPYFRAFNTLVEDVKGKVIDDTTTHFSCTLTLPVVGVKEDQLNTQGGDYQFYLEKVSSLPSDKTNILVYAQVGDYPLLKQLFTQEKNHLVYSDNAQDVISHLHIHRFTVLIIYNRAITEEFIGMLQQIKRTSQRQRLLIYYIAEEVDTYLQEQLFALGVTDILHFPLHQTLIENKIMKRIQHEQEVNSYAQYFNEQKQTDLPLSTNDKLVQKAVQYIQKHAGNANFTIDALVVFLGISNMKCYRMFKETLNQSPQEILIDIRMQKAKLLLEQGGFTIAEISFECGFNDPKYFSKAFKKHFGCNPSQYKQEIN